MTNKTCKKYLSDKIRNNIKEYKNGKFISRKQAIAVSYSQVIKQHPRCNKSLRRMPNNNKPTKVTFRNSNRKGKKKMATFYNSVGDKIKTIHFGAKGMSDFTIHKDPERKKRYINRHKKRENWNDPMTAGALSRYILWQYPSYEDSKKYYKNKFKLD